MTEEPVNAKSNETSLKSLFDPAMRQLQTRLAKSEADLEAVKRATAQLAEENARLARENAALEERVAQLTSQRDFWGVAAIGFGFAHIVRGDNSEG